MSSDTMTQVCLEVPAQTLRLVLDLVKTLGGRRIEPCDGQEAVHVVPPLSEAERVGRMLRGARLRAGLTQSQLAEKIGAPQSHISEYETNKRNIPPAKAEELAAVLQTVAGHFKRRDSI